MKGFVGLLDAYLAVAELPTTAPAMVGGRISGLRRRGLPH
jgi:hypothetical protein